MTIRRTLRLAHRGDARRVPENTIDAFLAALDIAGCDGVELDVHLSADGEPVLLHDDTLHRVHGRPERVNELTVAQLEVLGMPSLSAVLDTLPHRAFLDVELKVPGGRRVVEVLASGRGPELRNAVVSSFDQSAIAQLRGLAPAWPCWLNVMQADAATIARALELGCVGISADWRTLDASAFGRAAAAGLDVAAWTVRRRASYDRLARLGAIAVCVEGAALDGQGPGYRSPRSSSG